MGQSIDLVQLADVREHQALQAETEKLRRIQVGNPDARRKLAKAVRRMLVIETECRA
jgi:hypothetical protein